MPQGGSHCDKRILTTRDVAQPGSATVWGTGGRKFKSCHPDNINGRMGVCNASILLYK